MAIDRIPHLIDFLDNAGGTEDKPVVAGWLALVFRVADGKVLVYKKEGMMVDDGMLARLMLRAKELGAMINIHAENPDLIDYYTEKFLSEGKTSAWYHYMSRPEFVEAEADKRAVHWAKHLDAP